MAQWTNETAMAALGALAAEVPSLKQGRRQSAEHSRWLFNTLRVLEQIFGQGSRYYLSIAELPWAETGSMMVGGLADPEGSHNPMAAIEKRHQIAYVQQVDFAQGILYAALDDLRQSGIENVYQGKNTGMESSEIVTILNVIERKLRKVVRAEPSKEREIQDAFENLLVGVDIAYSRETDSIEYSSKTYIPDFTFSRIDLALDVKLCSRVEREKEIIAEINDDILAYSTKYGNILFIVYDTGVIRDVDRFSRVFESRERVLIRVVKH